MLCALQFLGELWNTGIHTLLEVDEGLGNSTVQCNHCTGTVGLRTYGTELKAVACEGEGRGAVAVGIVNEQFRNLWDVHLQTLLASHGQEVFVSCLNVVEQFADLLAQEAGDDGRRSLVSTQTMGVGGTHDRGLQQSVMSVDTHQCLYDEGGEAQVLFSTLAGGMQQDTIVSRQAPVVMLTAAVDACKGLFVQQYAEAMLARNLLHH